MTRPSKTRLNLPIATMVIALIAALVLGSFGAAGAAGLTKGAVKKIATKVVKKQASTLTVGSAANAGNATLLAGQPAAAYKNQSYTYTLTASSASSDTGFPLTALPAGKYLASYSVTASFSSAPAAFGCFFIAASGAFSTATGIATGQGTTLSYVSGSTYIDTTTQPYLLDCEKSGGGTFTTPAAAGPDSLVSTIVLTRVDSVAPGASTGAPLTLVPRPGSSARLLP